MDLETIKRLKAWFFLRLAPEDWSQFGSSAASVLQTFDCDPDQEQALLRFAEAVICLEMQRLPEPRMQAVVAQRRTRELLSLGITREQLVGLRSIFGLLIDGGQIEIARDSHNQPVYTRVDPIRESGIRWQTDPGTGHE
jgi:hypothetical protein